MELQVGKKYRRRDGEVEEIVNFFEGFNHPYVSETNRAWASDGRWNIQCIEPDPLDLIEEVVEGSGTWLKDGSYIPDEDEPSSGDKYERQIRFEHIENSLDLVEEVASCDLEAVKFNTLETLGKLRHLLCFAQGLALGMNHSGKHSAAVQKLKDARLAVEEIEAAIKAEQAS